MVVSCSALNCTRRWQQDNRIKFHRFPTNPDYRKLWINAMRRDNNYNPSVTAVICEKHFGEDDYQVYVHGNRVLKKDVIPSYFDFPDHLIEVIKNRKPPINRGNQGKQPVEPCSTEIFLEVEPGQPVESSDNYTLLKVEPEQPEECDIDNVLEVEPEHEQPSCVIDNVLEIKPEQSSCGIDNVLEVESEPPCGIDNVFEAEPISEVIIPYETGNQVNNNSDYQEEPSASTFVERTHAVRRRRDPVFFGDFKESDLEFPDQRKRFWKIANQTVGKLRNRNKYYQCQISPLKQKIIKQSSNR